MCNIQRNVSYPIHLRLAVTTNHHVAYAMSSSYTDKRLINGGLKQYKVAGVDVCVCV